MCFPNYTRYVDTVLISCDDKHVVVPVPVYTGTVPVVIPITQSFMLPSCSSGQCAASM